MGREAARGRGWRRRLKPANAGRLCRRVVKGKVLKIDRPWAGGFKGFRRFKGFRGGGIALRAMSFVIPLRGMENHTTGLRPQGGALNPGAKGA